MNFISPKRLKRGNRVAIIAPASPFKTDELAESLDIIKEMGLVPILGSNVKNLHSDRIHAAPVMDRVDELMWAFSDPSIHAVVAATGGYGSAGVLPYLDYDVIRRSRKPLLGMSDITALNNGILAAAGLCSINGQSPNVRLDEGRLKTLADSASLKLVFELMMSDKEWGQAPFAISRLIPRTISSGRASGHVIGCNCDTFVHLLGTPFMPEVDGAILMIEDVHKDSETLARQLLHLELAGVFERVAGIVIGEFIDIPKKTDERVPASEDVLLEFFEDGPPCSYGYSFSHGDYTCPIPVGAQCEMDADSGEVSFRFTMSP